MEEVFLMNVYILRGESGYAFFQSRPHFPSYRLAIIRLSNVSILTQDAFTISSCLVVVPLNIFCLSTTATSSSVLYGVDQTGIVRACLMLHSD